MSILMLSYSKSKVYVKNLMSFYVWISPIDYSSKSSIFSDAEVLEFMYIAFNEPEQDSE